MTLIDGDRIITAQLYDDEHEEFIEQKMSIIDNINAYTNEGVTEADIVEQTRWIPVSERLPEEYHYVLVSTDAEEIFIADYLGKMNDGTDYFDDGDGMMWEGDVVAWMPLPEPYKAESEG